LLGWALNNLKVSLIISLFIASITYSKFSKADPTVRAYDISAIEVYASTSAVPTTSMVSEAPSSSAVGNAEDNPIVSYIPLNGTDSQSNFTIISDSSKLPGLVTSGGTVDSFIMIRLLVDNDSSTDLNVNVAVQDDSSYESFNLLTSDSARLVAANTDDVEVYAIFSLDDLCEQTGSNDVCSGTNDMQEDLLVYFYLDENKESNSSVTTSENGLFLKLKISNKIPENNFTLSELKKGDNRLTAVLSDGDDITQMGDDIYQLYVFRYSGSTEQAVTSVGAAIASGSNFTLLDSITEGTVDISNVSNGEPYNFAFSLVNKYQFASNLSVSKVQTPEDIEAFLNSQACYIFSAGFKERHFIVDYFRSFRDEILLKNRFGNVFVAWYYRTAPSYAPLIYKSKTLSFFVRVAGYFIYFILRFWIVLVMLMLAYFTFHIYKLRQQKLV